MTMPDIFAKGERPKVYGVQIMRDYDRGCFYVRVDFADTLTQDEMTSLFDAIDAWAKGTT